MKVLVSTTTSQSTQPGDFSWTIDGELVIVGGYAKCDSHLHAQGGLSRCGCDRAFVGLGSSKSTTTAVVAELDITRDAFIEMLAEKLHTGHGFTREEAHEQAVAEVDDVLEFADSLDLGRIARMAPGELYSIPDSAQ